MLRDVMLIMARVVVALLVAAGTLFFFVVSPHDEALRHIDRVTDGVSEYLRAIEGGLTKLKVLPGVTAIKPQVLGSARAYIQRLDSVLPNFNVSQAPAPQRQTPAWRNRHMDLYNELIKTTSFADKISSSYDDLHSTYNFLTHHRTVLNTLAKLLEYNPDAETKGSAEIVAAKLEEAVMRHGNSFHNGAEQGFSWAN